MSTLGYFWKSVWMRGSVAGCSALLLTSATTLFAQTVRDSAGIRIVMNVKPTWTPAQQLRLSAAPTLVIGDRPEEPYLLSQVRGAFRLTDGRIVLAEGSVPELRVFDATGQYIRKFGGKGDGPGEFRQLEYMYRLAADTIAVRHERDAISRFAPNGTFLKRTDELGGPKSRDQEQIITDVSIPLNGGARLLLKKPFTSNASVGTVYYEMVRHVIVDASNKVVKDLGLLPTNLRYGRAEASGAVFLAPSELVAQNQGSSFYIGLGAEYSVTRYSASGAPTQIIRRAWSPPAISPADLDAYKDEYLARWSTPGAERDRYRKVLEENKYSPTLPAFSALLLDNVGRLWSRRSYVRDYAAVSRPFTMSVSQSTWSVFSAAGIWLGDVTMPARFTPTDLGADYVLGVQRDADNVPMVVLYKLGTKP